MRIQIGVILFVLLQVSLARGTTGLPPVVLPLDEGIHAYTIEWWYYTGHLETTDDGPPKRFGFETTVFRKSLLGNHKAAYVGHFAFIDLSQKTYHAYEKTGIPALTEVPVQAGFSFSMANGNWRMEGSAGQDWISFEEKNQGVFLELKSQKPAVLYGDQGILDYGGEYILAYYSRPRMEVSGVVNDRGEFRKVRGTAWMDHQWGDADVRQLRWKWFSIQLSDFRELMFFQTLPKDREAVHKTYGAFIDPWGRLTEIPEEKIEITDLDCWKFKKACYPIETQIKVPWLGLDLQVSAGQPNQRFRVRGVQFTPIYWEGSCKTMGTLGWVPVEGVGFNEFVGYE